MAIGPHRSERLQRLAHVLAAVVILLHGYGDVEKGHAMGWLYIVIGLAALALGLAHHRLKGRFARIDAVFHLIEAIMAELIGVSYLHEGKTYLPWASFAAALPYLWLMFRKHEPAHR